MIAMAVAAVALEPSADHVGTESANHSHDVVERHVVAVPHLECFFRSLGKSKIGSSGETLFDGVVTVGRKQLQGANDAEFIQEIAANFVLAAFAAIQGELQCGHTVAARFEREHAAIFVVGMRDRVHQTPRGMQTAQHLFQPGIAGIDRKRFGIDPGGWNLRQGCRRQEREKQAEPDTRP